MAGSKDGGKRHDTESHYRCAAMSHPTRQRIAHLLGSGAEAGADDIATALQEAPGRVAYHLRVLRRRDALKVVPRCRPGPVLYRFSAEAEWAREMLTEEDE